MVPPGAGTSAVEVVPGAVGVGEHVEQVSDQEVDLIAKKRGQNSKIRKIGKADDRLGHNAKNIVSLYATGR